MIAVSILRACALILLIPSLLFAEEVCFFAMDGKIYQARSKADVPEAYRHEMRCMDKKDLTGLGAPKEIELDGSLRRVNIASSLGRINLRWQRKAEDLFGRTPERAMTEAARAVSKALKQSGFPPELATLNQEWEVVFMDEASARSQTPDYLSTGCHPGWMTPPGNIYIVVERAAGGCGGGQKLDPRSADAQLAVILMHELGHSVEYKLLGGTVSLDRKRAEGFASWFEQYAASESSLTSGLDLKGERKKQALSSFRKWPGNFEFSGSSEDYSRASLYFDVVVKRGGITALMDVYKLIKSKGISFWEGVEQRLSLTPEKLDSEARRLAES